MSFTGTLFIEEGLLTGTISDDVFLVNSCQVLQFLAKYYRFEGQVVLTCFCRFVCLPFRNMYILKMMCTYNICEIKNQDLLVFFRWCLSAGPNNLFKKVPCSMWTHLMTNKQGLYLAPSSHVSLLVVTMIFFLHESKYRAQPHSSLSVGLHTYC